MMSLGNELLKCEKDMPILFSIIVLVLSSTAGEFRHLLNEIEITNQCIIEEIFMITLQGNHCFVH